jgi:hypothetical protein
MAREPASDVATFLASLEHPLKPEVELLRSILLSTAPDLIEGIKWNAPSYSRGGRDIITFNLRAKDQVRLIFHCGAKATKLSGPLVADDAGLLEWAGHDRGIATFSSSAEIRKKRSALAGLIGRWLEAAAEI